MKPVKPLNAFDRFNLPQAKWLWGNRNWAPYVVLTVACCMGPLMYHDLPIWLAAQDLPDWLLPDAKRFATFVDAIPLFVHSLVAGAWSGVVMWYMADIAFRDRWANSDKLEVFD